MMTIIGCSQCGKQEHLPIEFEFTARVVCCNHCHNARDSYIIFHFCDLVCFTAWYKGVLESGGINCWECRGTGYSSGFESNGTCELCKGAGILSMCEMVGFAR
jgi:RecJ-like exonuclease